MSSKTIRIWAPALFLGSLSLLLYKSGLFIQEPIWTGVFTLCSLLTTGILFLNYKELDEGKKDQKKIFDKKEKEVKDLLGVLDETHVIYREKIDKLEVNIAEIEAETREEISEKEEELMALQGGYKQLHESLTHEKNQSKALQNSLNDALDLARELRQKAYLYEEHKAHIPSDLIHKYNQLKEQFSEKSQLLKTTRYELFIKEGELEALKKDWLHREDAPKEESPYLEIEQLEIEVEALEALISKLLEKTHKAPKKKLEQMLELPLEV